MKGVEAVKIDEMQAGREMDALIAEKVMGFTHYVGDDVPNGHAHSYLRADEIPEVWLKELPNRDFVRFCKQCGDMPNYSTHIEEAWEVVEWMKDWNFTLDWLGSDWQTMFQTEDDGEFFSNADTAPLAICRAALKAVLGSDEI